MILRLLLLLFRLAELVILIRCVLSFMPNLYNGFTRAIYAITEPMLSPIRNLMGRFGGGMGLDFSPMVAIIIIALLERLVFILF